MTVDEVRISGEYGRYLADRLRYILSLNILEATVALRTVDKYEPRDYSVPVNDVTIAYVEKAARILEGVSEEEVGYEVTEYWGRDSEQVVARARKIRADTEHRLAREIALSQPLDSMVRILNENVHVRRLGRELTAGDVAQLYRADHDDVARKELMQIVPLSEEELREKVERWERDCVPDN